MVFTFESSLKVQNARGISISTIWDSMAKLIDTGRDINKKYFAVDRCIIDCRADFS